MANLYKNVSCCNYLKNKNKPTITNTSIEFGIEWAHLLSTEKPNNTVDRPVFSFRKVLNGIVYVLRTGYQ
jgi:hypothetical protein